MWLTFQHYPSCHFVHKTFNLQNISIFRKYIQWAVNYCSILSCCKTSVSWGRNPEFTFCFPLPFCFTLNNACYNFLRKNDTKSSKRSWKLCCLGMPKIWQIFTKISNNNNHHHALVVQHTLAWNITCSTFYMKQMWWHVNTELSFPFQAWNAEQMIQHPNTLAK